MLDIATNPPSARPENPERPTLPRNQGQNACARLGEWLEHVALPYWLARGVDWQAGGFHECLDFTGEPLRVDKRLRTMARQTFCFASAIRHGWGDPVACHDAVAHGISFLNQHARQPDNTFARTFAFDGALVDPARDAYDHAFLLFAAASAVHVGSVEARQLGNDVLQQLEEEFYLGPGNGFREVADSTTGVDVNGVRRANPHMHLLEAFTAWHRVTGDRQAHTLAADIAETFLDRMFDADTGSLREFMDADLAPLPDARANIREPGHAFEWSWLLYDFDRNASARTRDAIDRLCSWAVKCGTNPHTGPHSGLIRQQVTRQGRILDGTSRSWSQAEAVRAMFALERLGASDTRDNVATRLDILFDHHITPAPSGLWFDRIAADGTVLSESVPASILYHLISAYTAVLDDRNA